MKKWKKIALWSLAAVVVLVAGVVITLVLLLQHSKDFRRDILARVQSSLQESTGARLEVRDFGVRLSNLSLDLYNIVVHGKEPATQRPLLQVDHIQVGLTIDSLLGRKWHVRNILVDHPVASMTVNKAGENNLPQPAKKSTSSNSTSVFDLGIRDLKLDRGEIYYNDQKTPLDAELRNFKINAGYDPTQSKYSGAIGYQDGRIVYGAYAPVEHDMQAAFGVTPQNFILDKLELKTGKSRVELHAAVNNYSSPNLQAEGRYEATLVTGDFQRILKDPSLPSGTVLLTGQVNYQADPNRPMLQTVSVAGNISSSGLAVKTSSLQTEVREIFANYKLAHGNAEVSDIHARILGGTLNGKLTIRDVSGASDARLHASVKGLSLEQVQAGVHNASLKQARLGGTISADADAKWAKTLDNLTARADAVIKASLRQNNTVPLDGAIHASYDAAHKQVAFTRSYIRTPQTTLDLNGAVSNRSQLQVALRSQDLHELELIAAGFQQPASSQEGPGKPKPEPLGLYGKANLNATVRGSVNAPQVDGRVEGSDLRVRSSSWKTLRADFSANPSQASLNNSVLEAVPQGRIRFSGHTQLKNWAYTSTSPLAAEFGATQISIADLERLSGKTYPVTGTLALNLSVRGTQDNPSGEGTLTVTNAKVSTEPVQNLNVKFHGDGQALFANLTVHTLAGTATADARYAPKNQEYQVQIKAQDFRLEKLQTVKERNLQIAGGVNLNVNGSGTVKDPQLEAVLEAPQLMLNKQAIQGVKAQTTVRNHLANIAVDSDVAKVSIKARGTVGIEAPYMADVRLDTGKINFQPLVAIYAPAQAANLSGQSELHVTVRGPLAEKEKVDAHLEIPNLSLAYREFQLAAAKPIIADYQKGTVVLQPTSLRGTGTTIDAQATVPINSVKTASFLIQGNVDLQIAQLFMPDLQSSGQLQFDVDSRKYGVGSNLNGKIRIVNANLHTADSPVGLERANGVINLTQTRLEIASFQGQVGGGTINATGAVAYRPSVQFNLGLSANNIRMRYPDGVRTILASNLALTGNTQASLLSGQVKIERVSFTPDFDLSSFVGQFSGESSDSGTPGSLTQGMKLNIAVQSTSQMNLVSSQVSLRGDANLRVAGTAAAPVVLGRTNLTGGEFFLAGNRYEIQQGTVDFLNPVRTEPVLNLQVRTTINEYNITLGLRGPVARLETTYTSDPALPPVDIINLIARGKTVESAAANPNPPGTLGAQAALASTISSQVSGKIAKLAGVSQLQIDPGLGTDNGENPGARIAIQQRVTSNLLVTFATDITSTQRQAIQIEYKFNPRWSVSGTRNQNGGFGVDGRYRKDF